MVHTLNSFSEIDSSSLSRFKRERDTHTEIQREIDRQTDRQTEIRECVFENYILKIAKRTQWRNE